MFDEGVQKKICLRVMGLASVSDKVLTVGL